MSVDGGGVSQTIDLGDLDSYTFFANRWLANL